MFIQQVDIDDELMKMNTIFMVTKMILMMMMTTVTAIKQKYHDFRCVGDGGALMIARRIKWKLVSTIMR